MMGLLQKSIFPCIQTLYNRLGDHFEAIVSVQMQHTLVFPQHLLVALDRMPFYMGVPNRFRAQLALYIYVFYLDARFSVFFKVVN